MARLNNIPKARCFHRMMSSLWLRPCLWLPSMPGSAWRSGRGTDRCDGCLLRGARTGCRGLQCDGALIPRAAQRGRLGARRGAEWGGGGGGSHELIERNVKRASDKGQDDYMAVTYEAYGLGGAGIVVEVLTGKLECTPLHRLLVVGPSRRQPHSPSAAMSGSRGYGSYSGVGRAWQRCPPLTRATARKLDIGADNLNRAAAEVRLVVQKNGGKMADPGSVLFNFERRGYIVLTDGEARRRPIFAAREMRRVAFASHVTFVAAPPVSFGCGARSALRCSQSGIRPDSRSMPDSADFACEQEYSGGRWERTHRASFRPCRKTPCLAWPRMPAPMMCCRGPRAARAGRRARAKGLLFYLLPPPPPPRGMWLRMWFVVAVVVPALAC